MFVHLKTFVDLSIQTDTGTYMLEATWCPLRDALEQVHEIQPMKVSDFFANF